jgi:preprotein translocase subunit SecF
MGILLGTYSSVFNASPIAYDLLQYKKRKQEEKEKAAKK